MLLALAAMQQTGKSMALLVSLERARGPSRRDLKLDSPPGGLFVNVARVMFLPPFHLG